jgi:hypothetical protein
MARWETCSGSDEDAMDNIESLLHGFTLAVTLAHLASRPLSSPASTTVSAGRPQALMPGPLRS